MKSDSNFFKHLDKKKAERHVIPVAQGVAYTKKFREILRKNAEQLKQIFDLPRAELFDRNAIELLLRQRGAESIRFYYGADENNEVKLILVPVDKNGRDIFVPLIKSKRPGYESKSLTEEDSTDEFEEEDFEETDESEEGLAAENAAATDPSATVSDDAQLVNSGQRCPNVCDDISVLNGQE